MTSTCNRSLHSQCTDKHHLYHSNLTYLELASEDVVNLARTYSITHLDTTTCGQYTQSEMLWAKLQSWRMPVGMANCQTRCLQFLHIWRGFLGSLLALGLGAWLSLHIQPNFRCSLPLHWLPASITVFINLVLLFYILDDCVLWCSPLRQQWSGEQWAPRPGDHAAA